jgi:F-type H+-transporting ATPase subunit gamma
MQTKVIKQKIKSVGNIKKITKTMEMVSAAKMKKAIDTVLTIRPFHSEAQTILDDIGLDPFSAHPLIRHNQAEGEIVIIMASNKGLCGAYNTNIYRKLLEAYGEEERKTLKVIAVGKYAEKIAKRLRLQVLASFNTAIFSQSEARVVTKMIIESYVKKEIGGVRLLYTHFTSGSVFTPTLMRVLPFESEHEMHSTGNVLYNYEPDQASVLSSIIPMMLNNIIYGAVLEGYASEHSARMFAMKNATDNAGELQKDLKLYYNRARQDAVTQEIAEITSGAMAISI